MTVLLNGQSVEGKGHYAFQIPALNTARRIKPEAERDQQVPTPARDGIMSPLRADQPCTYHPDILSVDQGVV